MTVVSTKEFNINQKKYFDLAMNEQVFIQRGKNRFMVTMAHQPKKEYKEPDEDLQKAITIDELREKMHKRIHELFSNK